MDLAQISQRVSYTELVYQRVNKKLNIELSKPAIEALVQAVLSDATTTIERRGKNYYVSSVTRQVQLVVNAGNFRLITVNKLWKSEVLTNVWTLVSTSLFRWLFFKFQLLANPFFFPNRNDGEHDNTQHDRNVEDDKRIVPTM